MINLNRASYSDNELSVIHSMAIDLIKDGKSLQETAKIIGSKLHRTQLAVRQQMYFMGVSRAFKTQKSKTKLVKYAEYKTAEGEEFIVFKKVKSDSEKGTANSYGRNRKTDFSRGRRVSLS